MFNFFSLELISLILFVVPLVVTPGPAVIAISQTALSFGFRAAFFLVLGVNCGFLFLTALSAFPLAYLFREYPASKYILAGLGVLYVSYLAYKMSFVKLENVQKEQGRLKFLDGFIVMVLNPKAYLIMLSVFSNFTLGFEHGSLRHLSTVGLAFVATTFFSDIILAFFVSLFSRLKPSPRTLVMINRFLAAIMLISVLWAFFSL